MTSKIHSEYTFGPKGRYTVAFRDNGDAVLEANGKQIALYEKAQFAIADILEMFEAFPPDTEEDALFHQALKDITNEDSDPA